jgi:hypothetical protein
MISKKQREKDINDVDEIYNKCKDIIKKQRGSNSRLLHIKSAMLNYINILEYSGEDIVRLNRLRKRINNRL